VWTGPVYVTYEPTPPAAVGDPRPAADLALAARPVPSRGAVTAEFTLPVDEPRATLAVYDLSGRRVRDLLDAPLAAGVHRVVWDGRAADGHGRAGLYFLRLETRRGAVATKVLILE
jgi:methionine-rich copper-binding protein CopC